MDEVEQLGDFARIVFIKHCIPVKGESMNITPRKSKQIVDSYLRSKSSIQAEMIEDVAKALRRKHRGGSIAEMSCFLRKALGGNRLFQYEKEGQNFYETKEARRTRCGLNKFASLMDYVNATEVEPALA
jgi:hypothetical protein